MLRYFKLFAFLLLVSGLFYAARTEDAQPNREVAYARWTNGPPADENFFPIGVWLQSPRNAARYKAAGINVYVALWRGLTTNQLDELKAAGMRVICSQNRFGLEHKDDPTIIGWMHGDEPDNAQSLGRGKGYGPPIPPETIVRNYEKMRAADPTRPVLLNLGQGVAWDNYIGRGKRRNHPEDYPEYLKGCDIASFDIYPVVHENAEIAGKLEYVARGVERLVGWAKGEKIVWNCIECTHIGNAEKKATPEQVRAEVWMALIHGSRGLIYFVHQFQPTSNEAALLSDPQMLAAITAINAQIRELAPVLNSPSLKDRVVVSCDHEDSRIACVFKKTADSHYLFSVNMRNASERSSFELGTSSPDATVEVLGESRRLSMQSGKFSDSFEPYGVHLYRWHSGRRF